MKIYLMIALLLAIMVAASWWAEVRGYHRALPGRFTAEEMRDPAIYLPAVTPRQKTDGRPETGQTSQFR